MVNVMTNDGNIHKVEQDFVEQCRPIKIVSTMLDCSDENAAYIMPLPFDSAVLEIIQEFVKRKKDCLNAVKYLCIK